MTRGVSTAAANGFLTGYGGTATSYATLYVKLHTGDPGSAGTSNASANTTRVAATWSAASSGSRSMSNTPTWSTWASGSETLTDISLWDASTSGTFVRSVQLTASVAVVNGNDVVLTSLVLSITPLAA
jgi:hypothetical protein